MSPEMAEKIAQFVTANSIEHLNVMGGEFFVHPEWELIIHTLASVARTVRLVSNGDWASNPVLAKRIIVFLESHPHIYVSLSKDQWHTNRNTKHAASLLRRHKIPYNVAAKEETTEDSIVPVGRGEFHYGPYSMLGTYCSKPDRKYTFLVDEQGTIYKCAYGVWDYDTVDAYLHGGFRERFKEFSEKFYGTFVGSCGYCARGYQHLGCKKRK